MHTSQKCNSFLLSPPVANTQKKNSNALRVLLDKCRTLRSVKAWGIRGAGMTATTSLRTAYEARGIDLAWARPLPSQPSAVVARAGEPRLSQQLPFQSQVEAEGEEREEQEQEEQEACLEGGGGKACRLGCGAVPKALDAADHMEVRCGDGGVQYGPPA